MKRVRYAFAAVGVAPALGLMTHAAAAPAATAHARPLGGKTVRSADAVTGRRPGGVSPDDCTQGGSNHSWSGVHHEFEIKVWHYGHCVDSQQGVLTHSQAGLTERVRGYNQYGTMVIHNQYGGSVGGGETIWPTSFGKGYLEVNNVYMICGALLSNRHLSHVVYGPVCMKTPPL